jgi:hypothetical protein
VHAEQRRSAIRDEPRPRRLTRIDARSVAQLPTQQRLTRAAVDARIDLEFDFSAGTNPADHVNEAHE